jgi:hypothetical protein
MAILDPGDCAYHPNTLHTGVNVNKQLLGQATVMMPKAGVIGKTLNTVRYVNGATATGIYNKYHKLMHTDFFTITITSSG